MDAALDYPLMISGAPPALGPVVDPVWGAIRACPALQDVLASHIRRSSSLLQQAPQIIDDDRVRCVNVVVETQDVSPGGGHVDTVQARRD